MEIIKNDDLVWIDIQDPKKSDIQYLRDNYNFHPLIIDELSKETLRSKAENHDDHCYLVLHFPLFDEKERKTYPKELDFILSKNILVTTHFAHFDVLDDFFNKIKNDSTLKAKYLINNAGYLFYHLVTNLLNFSLRELDHIKLNIDKIEEEIFEGRHKEIVEEISVIRRDIINFRRIILPQRSVLESFADTGEQYFGKGIKHYLTSLVGKYMLVWNHLENHKEAAEALQATNESLLTTRTNQVIKTLTIITTILLPINVMSQILFVQLNSPFTSQLSFWIGIVIMTTIAIALLAIFRKQKWL